MAAGYALPAVKTASLVDITVTYHDSWIIHVLVVEAGLKVAEGS
jgi:hypothetical protein